MMQNKILMVEDDLGLSSTLKDFFEHNGLEVIHTATGGNAIELFESESPNLVLLDVVLPEKDGFEIITEIKKLNPDIPTILMTGSEFDADSEVKGYKYGAINYMKKPLLPQAVLALIQHLLALPSDLRRYTIADSKIELHSQYVDIDGERLKIREKDMQVLQMLLRQFGQVVSRNVILQRVWKEDSYEKNNNLDGCVSRLRKVFNGTGKFEIESVYGNGYMLKLTNEDNPQ